jgi:NO-binding membrane sensor protein with MHYT domain
MPDQMMTPHWNTLYIVLSVLIAAITSFFALELARRFRQNSDLNARLALGALLGYGIWAMHFVGMMAFELPTNVAYQLPLTLVSGVCAVLFLMGASQFMFSGKPNLPRILGSGMIAGTGICLMHYLGMAALQVNAVASYRTVPFVVSIAVAVGAASVAFFLFSRVMTSAFTLVQRLAVQLGAALVMGFAIAGMHYTGMAAVQYTRGNGLTGLVSGTDQETLVYLVIGATMVVFVATYIAILSDQLSSKTSGVASD